MQIAAILGLAVGVSYAFSHFFVRFGLDNSTPTSGVIINVAVNAIGLWGLTLLFSPLFPLASTSIWPFILSGLFAPTLAMEFHFRGIAHIGLARSSALLGTTPLFAVVLAVLFLGERPPAIMAVGGVSIAAGVILLNYDKAPGEKNPWWAFLLPMAAGMCFALRDVFNRMGLQSVPYPLAGAAVTATTSIVTMYMVLSFSKGWIGIQLPRRSFWLYVVSGVFLLIAYTCTFFALQRGMVSMVSPLININPLYSMILSYIFLQSEEKVTLKVVGGGSLIVGGAIAISLS